MMNRKGITLIELVLGIAIGAIVILMVGSLAEVGSASTRKIRRESQVNDDAYSALDLIQRAVRKAENVSVSGNCLIVDTEAYYVIGTSLVRGNACNSATNSKLIFDVLAVTFTPTYNNKLVSANLVIDKQIVGAGTRRFTYSVKATRRNP